MRSGRFGWAAVPRPISRTGSGPDTPAHVPSARNRGIDHLARTQTFQSPSTVLTTTRNAPRIRRSLGIAALITASALAWVVAGAAAIAAAPTAITGPVSAVGPTSATVSGTVNPGAQATTWYVEYGTSTSYGSQSASASAGSGSANVAVSRALSGLASGTTYHYRVVATNGAGTSRGADGIFATSAAPAAVTGAATNVTTSSATLNGTVDPNGRATVWYFEYGTSTSYGSKTAEHNARLGRERRPRHDRRLGSRARPGLPLPPRRDERRGHEPRRRPDALDRRARRR